MAAIYKRWYRSRKNQLIVFILLIFCVLYYSFNNSRRADLDLDITRSSTAAKVEIERHTTAKALTELNKFDNRAAVIEYIESRIQEALREDKGTGCEIPELDPFAKEVTQFDKVLPKVTCKGQDWVKCYLSECRVVKEILNNTKDILCTYRDIIYISDAKYIIGPPTDVVNDDAYILRKSDHVKVKCIGRHVNSIISSKWLGHMVGFRSTVHPKEPPPGRSDSINVLILGFDSTSRNGFIRRMPKSYKYLTNIMGATVLDGYNIVGDGTPAALFPILTGKNELELPDVRKKSNNNGTLDVMPFIFYKLKEDGYRTAYFEDMPWIGTFQYRFNGFLRQPADHYLRDFYLEEAKASKKTGSRYCIGARPQYQLMLDITKQFFHLDGKRFCFTFIADITHNDFNMISTADDDVVEFLSEFMAQGRSRDTLLMLMGDHGPRYAKVRDTLQGKLEERMPFMAILLPLALTRVRPHAAVALKANAKVLTTPHDIHATILDAMDLQHYWNHYKVPGADFTRGMTLLDMVPRNRSCSEAGVEPHWCACLKWQNVSRDDPMYERTARALLDYINALTQPVGSKCLARSLRAVAWVVRRRGDPRMLSFVEARDADGYVGKFGAKVKVARENYQLKIIVGPGHGIYEASLTYLTAEDKFITDIRDISRTNAYNNEPECISATHPHLNPFCYCND